MEDDRRRVGRVGAWDRSGTAGRKQKELGPPNLALVEPLAQELVLDRLEGRKVAGDRQWDEGGEQLYLFLGEDGLKWDTAGGGRVVGEDPGARCRTAHMSTTHEVMRGKRQRTARLSALAQMWH